MNQRNHKPHKKWNIGVVGATGMVGEVFLNLLETRKFPLQSIRLFASELSLGQSRKVNNEVLPIETLSENCFDGLDIVFFSSGDDISKVWAPKAVLSGAFAIDNSAAFRMDPSFPLIVPEVNFHLGTQQPTIIANPNCSTIQLVVTLHPLCKQFGLEQVRVATYQAVSGAGKAAVQELLDQSHQLLKNPSYKHLPTPQSLPAHIGFNCIPQVGGFGEDGFCSEERKIRLETRKILNLPNLPITAWTVRVPALNVHSEAAWITLKKVVSRDELISCLKSQQGLHVESHPHESYPMGYQWAGRDGVAIGRIHQDPDDPKTWMIWIVSDNLRKGAALNGIQIAEQLVQNQL